MRAVAQACALLAGWKAPLPSTCTTAVKVVSPAVQRTRSPPTPTAALLSCATRTSTSAVAPFGHTSGPLTRSDLPRGLDAAVPAKLPELGAPTAAAAQSFLQLS